MLQHDKTNGNLIIKWWEVIVTLVGWIVIASIFYATTNYRLGQLEERTRQLEMWKDKRIELLNDVVVQLTEMNVYLKLLCDKSGITYKGETMPNYNFK